MLLKEFNRAGRLMIQNSYTLNGVTVLFYAMPDKIK